MLNSILSYVFLQHFFNVDKDLYSDDLWIWVLDALIREREIYNEIRTLFWLSS